MQADRRRPSEYVTHAELREALEPILERHRESEPAWRLWQQAVGLGIVELLPVMLRDARVRQVLNGLSEGRWQRWSRLGALLGVFYVAVTLLGATLAILRTAGFLH